MAENNNSNYAGNLARAIGQGITFGFGDELEARIRSLAGGRTYGEEVADIRERIKKFRETNPVAAYGSEIVGSIPTGVGIAGLALRGGLRGAAKIGALEGGIYGIGEGEGLEGRATGAGLGAGLGAAGGKAAEKAFEGIAPLVGRFMKKTRGSEDVTIDSSPPDRRPMVKEAGSDEFVPLEKKVGKPGTRELKKRALSTQGLFENMGEEGALLEFPEIATGIDKYVYEIDFGALNNALKSDEYGPYAEVMRANLNRTFPGDTISVSRIEDYSDPFVRKKSKNFFEVNKDDVLFVGSESEKELIVRKPDGSPMSVRIADEQKGVEGKVSSSLKKGPFGVNPPVISQFEGDYLERPKPIIGRLAQDYSPVYNTLLDPKTLGFSPSVSKKSLTGEQIIARLKNQESVTKDELAYLGLENSLVKKDKYSLEDVRAIVRTAEPEIHIKSASVNDMNPDFELSYYDEQRIIPEGREIDYKEYVFQDQRPVKNIERTTLDEVELEVIQRIKDRILENTTKSKFSHYTDLENVIGHARVAKIDSPFDARDNAIVIEEIQSDLIAASNPKTNRMNEGEEYATPEKLGQALKEAQDFYKRNPKVKEAEQEIINTRKELDQAKLEDDVVNYDQLSDELLEKLIRLKNELSNSLENLTDDELEKASEFVTGNIKKKFIQNPPFSTNKAAARYFMQNVIKDAVRGGTKTILLPDYVDLAKYHGKEDVKSFKLNYTDVFDKLISDYKKQGMRLKTGTIKFYPDISVNLPFDNRKLRDLRPMKYVTFLNPYDDIDRSLIRRYSKGGKVDIKGGIGAMAPTHM